MKMHEGQKGRKVKPSLKAYKEEALSKRHSVHTYCVDAFVEKRKQCRVVVKERINGQASAYFKAE